MTLIRSSSQIFFFVKSLQCQLLQSLWLIWIVFGMNGYKILKCFRKEQRVSGELPCPATGLIHQFVTLSFKGPSQDIIWINSVKRKQIFVLTKAQKQIFVSTKAPYWWVGCIYTDNWNCVGWPIFLSKEQADIFWIAPAAKLYLMR